QGFLRSAHPARNRSCASRARWWVALLSEWGRRSLFCLTWIRLADLPFFSSSIVVLRTAGRFGFLSHQPAGVRDPDLALRGKGPRRRRRAGAVHDVVGI